MCARAHSACLWWAGFVILFWSSWLWKKNLFTRCIWKRKRQGWTWALGEHDPEPQMSRCYIRTSEQVKSRGDTFRPAREIKYIDTAKTNEPTLNTTPNTWCRKMTKLSYNKLQLRIWELVVRSTKKRMFTFWLVINSAYTYSRRLHISAYLWGTVRGNHHDYQPRWKWLKLGSLKEEMSASILSVSVRLFHSIIVRFMRRFPLRTKQADFYTLFRPKVERKW